MKYLMRVTSVGPDALPEKVKRASGEEVEVDIPAVAVELTSESEEIGTVSLWLTGTQVREYVKDGLLAVGSEWELTLAPKEKKA